VTELLADASSSPRLIVGVLRETALRERRVALTPDTVARLVAAGLDVVVETGAGRAACFANPEYEAAGARATTREEVIADAGVLLFVGTLPSDVGAGLRAGQAVVGMFRPLTALPLVENLTERGVTMVSIDGLTRTLSRAQSMDVLASQSNVAGYKAVLVAADAYPRVFPLLMTAAGTARPAMVLVLGAGVAGLQAMGTAHRLGAVVTGYDVRPETHAEIASVGARVLQLDSVGPATGDGGYARALSDAERDAQQAELAAHVATFDVVITTAQVPGRRPPVLVTASTVAAMRPGSVIVDLAASPLGGNVEGSVPEETIVTATRVTIVGAGNLAAQVPNTASVAFSHNIAALLLHMVRNGRLVIDPNDEIQRGVVVTHGGAVVHPAVRELVSTSRHLVAAL
jgi:H+-translocating NAD(P) transhydrogenase subunit alpha